jgi:hypothetical protein
MFPSQLSSTALKQLSETPGLINDCESLQSPVTNAYPEAGAEQKFAVAEVP